MEPVFLVKELSDLFSAHEVPFDIYKNEWIVPLSKLPSIRATWYPREDTGLLEIDVLLEDQRIINESFAGIGLGYEGIKDALENFCINSFHVFLAAFWGLNDLDQVLTEEWNFQGKIYTVYIGNFGTRSSTGVKPAIPTGLFEAIENAIKNEPLESNLSWFRCFFCNLKEDQTFEALKDNEVWELGLSTLRSLQWMETNGYYSVRIFLIVRESL